MTEPKITISGNTLTIEAELDPVGEESASKKTMVLATTRGNKKIATDSGDIFVGLNVYRKVEA